MIAILFDEDVDGGIVEGFRRAAPLVDALRVQDLGLTATPDGEILEQAASAGRVVVTADRSTMTGEAWARVRDGRPMPGLVVVKRGVRRGAVIDDLQSLVEAAEREGMDGQVLYVPW